MRKWDLIFVLSMPRSGSTLFRLMLGNIEEVVSIPETHFLVFHKQYSNLSFLKEHDRIKIIDAWSDYWTVKKMFVNREELRAVLKDNAHKFKDILEYTIEFYLKENGHSDVKIVIEKSPPHIFFQTEIIKLFPESKAIYLIRDPRAVIGSLLDKSWSTHSIYTLSRSWNAATKQFQRINKSVILRYEDFISKNQQITNDLSVFLGLNSISENIFRTENFGETKGVMHKFQQELSKPLNQENIEKWRSQLSTIDCDQDIIEYVCGKMMKMYGYSLGINSRRKGFLLIMFIAQIDFLFRKIFQIR